VKRDNDSWRGTVAEMSGDRRLLIEQHPMTTSIPERDLDVDVLMRRPVCVDDSLGVVVRIAPLGNMDVDRRKDRPRQERRDADEGDQAANHARIMGGCQPDVNTARRGDGVSERHSWSGTIRSSPWRIDSLKNVAQPIVAFFRVRSTMGRTTGPHTRNALPGTAYRGSKKRVDRLSPFDPLPVDVWVFIAVAVIMLGISVAIIYNAL
jgi:hypothetical protein